MEFSFALAITSLVVFFIGADSIDFQIVNNCPFIVWPGILTGSGSPMPTTGFELAPAATQTVTIGTASPWSGRVWGRTGCSSSSGSFICETGDCGSGQVTCAGGGRPPASLAAFTLNDAAGKDFYDTSLVDGFNLPIGIQPTNGGACQSSICAGNANSVCPPELRVVGAGGGVVACKSACLAFQQEQYCCTGHHGTPETCPPTNYSLLFKGQCPQSYSYAYDDKSSTFTCQTGTNYVIKFCP